MTQTVLITGCSSGFGKASALTFRSAGWNVVATMRNTDQWEETQDSAGIFVTKLDVQNEATIHQAITLGVEQFGRIDCVVNNAGMGLFSVFEATPMATINVLFSTNVFGPMLVTQAILPHFQANGGGRIINITSGTATVPEPLMSVYSASKGALHCFTEALQYEMQNQNVAVKMVEPGFVASTQFTQQAQQAADAIPIPSSYQAYVAQRIAFFMGEPPKDYFGTENDVAEAVLAAATDTTGKLRFLVGQDVKDSDRMRRAPSTEYDEWRNSRFAPR
ncbi:SDR family oxidoreductase [Dictyobacter arantiisoli]|uniref:Short-chain dehydrogenase/reductase n=1 Tax=Dictyobacter arantiisoli TaxID=2014874 RepID=A0A5A5TDE0_9CHLR|nr:SDR family oxidoreductase [Dictyobacter arantiisoli]GCF09225.1 short-chain dehydrogenase/reductase [Dictyobacter arantiisoli]